MTAPFLTIAQDTTNEIIIKKSRFICSLFRVESEEQAQAAITKINKLHRKATHNCFAYLIGDHDQIQRESDNGEPSGTAGVPMLEALKANQLHNVLAVVTRYFGGIKLGAGGLIRAYSNSVSQAIEQAGLVERVEQAILKIDVAYSLHDSLLYYLKQANLEIAEEEYGASVIVSVYVDESQIEERLNQLTERFNDQLTIKKGPTRIHELPYQKQ
ncbi:MAG: YigZ family protein [Limosilactobacillus mucosae]|nr:YigZ family protein [Limosilactobacillus mucosae]MCI6053429.1 YigZ family protein [Limosilactobacillus mucosae]